MLGYGGSGLLTLRLFGGWVLVWRRMLCGGRDFGTLAREGERLSLRLCLCLYLTWGHGVLIWGLLSGELVVLWVVAISPFPEPL